MPMRQSPPRRRFVLCAYRPRRRPVAAAGGRGGAGLEPARDRVGEGGGAGRPDVCPIVRPRRARRPFSATLRAPCLLGRPRLRRWQVDRREIATLLGGVLGRAVRVAISSHSYSSHVFSGGYIRSSHVYCLLDGGGVVALRPPLGAPAPPPSAPRRRRAPKRRDALGGGAPMVQYYTMRDQIRIVM